jgi:hypothetical protein
LQDVDYVPKDSVPKEPLQTQKGTYAEIKEAVRRSGGGDPAKEWMSGSSTKGSTVYKAAKPDHMYNATKRSVEDASPRFEENSGKSGVTAKIKEQLDHAADTLEDKMGNMKEKFGNAVSSITGNDQDTTPGGKQAVNARAVWEATRSEEQKQAENANRKSQLTDEAAGDNPKEKTARMDKQTLPDPLDTPH